MGHRRKTWWDCFKMDMESFGLSHDDVHDRSMEMEDQRGNWLMWVYLENGR